MLSSHVGKFSKSTAAYLVARDTHDMGHMWNATSNVNAAQKLLYQLSADVTRLCCPARGLVNHRRDLGGHRTPLVLKTAFP